MEREIHDIYDVIMKIIISTYTVDFLKFIGIDKNIKKILKTDFVKLDGKKIYLDFLCLFEDGTIGHIEFQFPKANPKDLDRFFDYNIVAEVKYGTRAETYIINFTAKKDKDITRKIGESKSFHPKQIYLGDIDFKKYWENINMKAKSNLKLTSFEEITLLITSLVVECENKAEILGKAVKLLKNKSLFDEKRFEYIQGIIELEVDNLISKEEKNKIKGDIDMSPQAQQVFAKAFEEVHKKAVYEARLDGIDEGKKEGSDETKEKIARNLKGKITDEEISQSTGLDLSKVKEL